MLSIAGSDSIGGAGIQADVKTACAFRVYAMTVITAITAQNTRGVDCWKSTGAMIKAQLDAVLGDIRPDAVKIGMLPDNEAVDAVADAILRYGLDNVVLDPVCVATSGDQLTRETTLERIKARLFPLSTVVTPNIPEAKALFPSGEIKMHGAKYLYLKGGHGSGGVCTDTLMNEDGQKWVFESPRIDTVNTHGTGCTLSSAIASLLARGYDVPGACASAHKWLHRAIEEGAIYDIGHGHGPVNHFTPYNHDSNS